MYFTCIYQVSYCTWSGPITNSEPTACVQCMYLSTVHPHSVVGPINECMCQYNASLGYLSSLILIVAVVYCCSAPTHCPSFFVLVHRFTNWLISLSLPPSPSLFPSFSSSLSSPSSLQFFSPSLSLPPSLSPSISPCLLSAPL